MWVIYIAQLWRIKQAETGLTVSDLCREHNTSSASFYKWRAKFGAWTSR
ncbi:hypothetical protein C1H71_02840 [Iodobacter fluviatilis]|uniref:Transposase n=1 Tax=Iodobacter fluviatilis TaxID=537 RepID=A0A7G3G6Y9_9NEIS|nr:hypothetical protein C1H71_02840 [Iodobacter fluviatilis]